MASVVWLRHEWVAQREQCLEMKLGLVWAVDPARILLTWSQTASFLICCFFFFICFISPYFSALNFFQSLFICILLSCYGWADIYKEAAAGFTEGNSHKVRHTSKGCLIHGHIQMNWPCDRCGTMPVGFFFHLQINQEEVELQLRRYWNLLQDCLIWSHNSSC